MPVNVKILLANCSHICYVFSGTNAKTLSFSKAEICELVVFVLVVAIKSMGVELRWIIVVKRIAEITYLQCDNKWYFVEISYR